MCSFGQRLHSVVRIVFCLAISTFLLSTSLSCAAVGVLGQALPQNVNAKYAGLKEQSVGVMVWADSAIALDWGTIALDLGSSIESKLQASEADEVKGATYPYKAASYVRYQRDHPAMDALPITDVAPKLGVSRLVYVEVHEFRTRSNLELELFRGEAIASLQVIEISSTGVAKIAYSEDNVHAVYPKDVPTDGLPNLGDARTYSGAIDALATQVVNSLTKHEEEPKS